MSFLRVLLSILFPPLAVYDRGCGSMLIVFLLTLCGWVPGVIAALIILNKNNWPRLAEVLYFCGLNFKTLRTKKYKTN